MVKISDQIEETPHIGRDDEHETIKVVGRDMQTTRDVYCDDVVEQVVVSEERRIRIKVNGRCRHIQFEASTPCGR